MLIKRKILDLEKKSIRIQEVEYKGNKEGKDNNKFSQMMLLASELGFSLSLPIVGGAIFGQLLDSKFGTSPKITLSFIFTGLIIGILNTYFILKESEKE